MRRLAAPEVLTWRSFKQGMLVCHQSFFAKASLVEPYDLQYRFSADFDWCIRVMKQARALHPHHGATLRTGEYHSPSCLVRITGRNKEIAQVSRANILYSRKTYTLWESPLYPALYSIGVSTQNIPMFSPKTSGCNGARHPDVLHIKSYTVRG